MKYSIKFIYIYYKCLKLLLNFKIQFQPKLIQTPLKEEFFDESMNDYIEDFDFEEAIKVSLYAYATILLFQFTLITVFEIIAYLTTFIVFHCFSNYPNFK